MSKTAKEKALASAINEMAVLPPMPQDPLPYEVLVHMKAIESLLSDLYEAGMKEGYTQALIESINPQNRPKSK